MKNRPNILILTCHDIGDYLPCYGTPVSAPAFDRLAEEGVVLVSDHGASFYHSGATLYDGGTKVSLLMRWPDRLAAGHRLEALTSHVDILPTLLTWLHLPIPSHVQGLSMDALLSGDRSSARAHVFAEKNYTNYYDPSRMVRSDALKYIHKGLRTCLFDFVIPELELCSLGHRQNKDVLKFYSGERTHEELYDLKVDPGERHNLAQDEAYAMLLTEMRAALQEHLERTDDPYRDLENGLLMPSDEYVFLQART